MINQNKSIEVTILIPTFNRPKCIQDIINRAIEPYQGSLFHFFVCDSSEGNETESIIKNFNLKSDRQIKYLRYNSQINGDQKTIDAIRHIHSEYLYLLGDGLIPNFNRIEGKIKPCLLDHPSIIGIYSTNSYFFKNKNRFFEKGKIYKYDNCISFANSYFALMTLYGASIVRTKSIIFSYETHFVDSYFQRKSGFVYLCSVFNYLANFSSECRCYILFDDFFNYSINKKDSGWRIKGEALNVFCKDYCLSIDALPAFFDGIKDDLKMSHGSLTDIFSNYRLLGLRAYNNITIKKIRENKVYIRQTVPHPFRFFLCLIFPPRLLMAIKKRKKHNKIEVLD